MMISRMTCALVGAALLACGSVAGPASATLTLTPTGIADGFTLTTFATFPTSGCCSGPFGMAVTNNGNVIVSLGSGPLYVFPNVDGQSPGTALFTQSSIPARRGMPRRVVRPMAGRAASSSNSRTTAQSITC